VSALADLNSRWTALPPRTRTLAVIAGVFALGALIYLAAWRPLQKDLQRLRASVPSETEQLEWMRAHVDMAKALRAKSGATRGNLVTSIEQTANARGLRSAITRIDAEGTSGARVTLESVSFNALVSWLSELHSNYGAAADDVTIEAKSATGTVNARIRLRTGGS
jgi:type II secretory pathway component PulM